MSMYAILVPVGIVLGLSGIAIRLGPLRSRYQVVARWLLWLYGAAVAVAWVQRYRFAGHLPVFGTYESALSLAVTLMVVAIVWEALGRYSLVLTAPSALISAALLAHGLAYDSTPYALTISERSLVVDIHAWVAWAAFAVLAINAIVAIWIAVADRLGGGEQALRQSDGRAGLERLLVFSLELGFFVHTAMLISGSFYKFLLFGTPWSFDPIETLGFVAWMAYGTLLHMHLFARWKGRRLATWCAALFVLLIVSYRGIVYFPSWSTYHIFDMDLRMHLTGEEIPDSPPSGHHE